MVDTPAARSLALLLAAALTCLTFSAQARPLDHTDSPTPTLLQPVDSTSTFPVALDGFKMVALPNAVSAAATSTKTPNITMAFVQGYASCADVCAGKLGAEFTPMTSGNGIKGKKLANATNNPFQSAQLLSTRGWCIVGLYDNDGNPRIYHGSELQVLSYEAGAKPGMVCVFIDIYGGRRAAVGNDYNCLCLNKLAKNAAKDNKYEVNQLWGSNSCPGGCGSCPCRVKFNGVMFTGWAANSSSPCYTGDGKPDTNAFDYLKATCSSQP